MKYNFEKADLSADKNRVLSIWSTGLTHEGRGAEFYDWLYLNNPVSGGFICTLANELGDDVGSQGISARSWCIEGEAAKVGILGDFVVSPEYRSLGPALTLLRNACEVGCRSFSFLYGFPNRKAVPVFKRAGYRQLGVMQGYTKVLKTKTYFDRKLPSIVSLCVSLVADSVIYAKDFWRCKKKGASELESEVDTRFDRLWTRVSSVSDHRTLMLERSSAFLRWRFFENEGGERKYKVFTLSNSTSPEGEIDGYVVYFIDNNNVLQVSDFFCERSRNQVRGLMSEFIIKSRALGVKAISLEFFGCGEVVSVLDELGFKGRRERPIYCAGDKLLLENPVESLWFMTSADEDQ